MGKETPDGRVDPHGGTLKQLHDGMPGGFVGGKLQGIMIHADPAVINKFFPLLLAAMPRFQITTPLRMAHFLSQLGHESGEFRFTEEIASGTQYEGRRDLGNTQKGDGVRFKGRGLIQLTGRTNYTAFGVFKGTDFTTDASAKTLATDPSLAVEVSGFFWKTRNLNPLADADNVVRVTEVVNGGHRGLADRKAKLARAKFFLIP
jgi:putative chitinase